MAAAVGITAGAGQYLLVLAGTVLALLLLGAATLVERLLPRRKHASDHSDHDIQMPNRRGTVSRAQPCRKDMESDKEINS
jgi:putative Mg2+ transporter-C (MgtC) family protein